METITKLQNVESSCHIRVTNVFTHSLIFCEILFQDPSQEWWDQSLLSETETRRSNRNTVVMINFVKCIPRGYLQCRRRKIGKVHITIHVQRNTSAIETNTGNRRTREMGTKKASAREKSSSVSIGFPWSHGHHDTVKLCNKYVVLFIYSS